MISCSDFLAEFGDYLDNVANPGLRARLEDHLRTCKSCQVIVDSTKKTIKFVTESDSFSLPDESVEPIVSKVMEQVRKKKD
jgi:predicted anti-sigma-YlaC factor YlaD